MSQLLTANELDSCACRSAERTRLDQMVAPHPSDWVQNLRDSCHWQVRAHIETDAYPVIALAVSWVL